MAKYITQLQVSLNEYQEEQLRGEGFMKVDVNLNKDPEGKKIYLWYKEGTSSPIARIQFSFNDEMSKGLSSAGFTKVDKNISVGPGGDEINLWYLSGWCNIQYDIPIVGVDASTDDDPQIFRPGWERMTCDLNRETGGNQIYLWVKKKKQVYVCDITATNSHEKEQECFKKGFIRMDESTNRGVGGVPVFIWYRLTTDPKGALTDLQVSTNVLEEDNFDKGGYIRVNQNLNEGILGYNVFMWCKKVDREPRILDIGVIFHLVKPDPPVYVIDKELNSRVGSGGWPSTKMFLCFYNQGLLM